MSRVLYLGQAIDRAARQSDEIGRTADLVSRLAAAVGWLVYRPAGAWRLDPESPPGLEIESVNRYALASAGAFIGVSLEAPSVGLWRELEIAQSAEIPTAVIGARVSWSLADVNCLGVEEVPDWLGALGRPSESVLARSSGTVPIAFAQSGSDTLGALPTRAHHGDAGLDLFTSATVTIPPGEFRDIPCGVRAALPGNIWGRITGRSSTLRSRGLLVAEGVIDSGYRGPLFAGVWNLGAEPVEVPAGDRIAQLLLHINVTRVHEPTWVTADEFSSIPGDGRGPSGFGSTGA